MYFNVICLKAKLGEIQKAPVSGFPANWARGLKTTPPSHLPFLSIWKCAPCLPRGSRSRAFIFSEPLASFRSFPSNSPGPWNCYEPFWWWIKARETVLLAVFFFFKKQRQFQCLRASLRFVMLLLFTEYFLLLPCLSSRPLCIPTFLGVPAVLRWPHSERAGSLSSWEETWSGHSFFCSLTANVCK